MTRPTLAKFAAAMLYVLACQPSVAQTRPTITVVNQSGAPALVKVVGPSPALVHVPRGGSDTAEVSGGWYHLRIRYGSGPKYQYAKGEGFRVTETSTHVSEITITLRAANGNLQESPSSEKEFADAP